MSNETYTYRVEDFDFGGDWFGTAVLALDVEAVPGKLGVVYEGAEPVEVVMAGWLAQDPCCPGGHGSPEELAAAPVVAEDASVAPVEWECRECRLVSEPEVWYRESVDRLTPESGDGDDFAAGVTAEYRCGDPRGFAGRALRVFQASMATRAAWLDAARDRQCEDLQLAVDRGEGVVGGVLVHLGELQDWGRELCRGRCGPATRWW